MERIHTLLGDIYMEERDGEYPGIIIGLERDDVRYSFAWLEVDQSEADNPILKVHVFNDQYDSPVFNMNIKKDRIDRLFKDGLDFGDHETYGEEN